MLVVVGVGCKELESPEYLSPQTLGGRSISVETLREGRKVYRHRCRACHGDYGDGMGPLGVHQNPQAADLRRGMIKFASVPAGELPLDADIERTLKHGLKGTAMLAWPMEEAEIKAVTQYIKTFSVRWREELAGTPIVVASDPWGSTQSARAVARGRQVYEELASCNRCHGDTTRRQQEAPDLKAGVLKTGDSPEALYRVIAAGIGGTAMPSWDNALSERDIWALVHYVREGRRGVARR
jgi:mono/diheme cytochrome c family protein